MSNQETLADDITAAQRYSLTAVQIPAELPERSNIPFPSTLLKVNNKVHGIQRLASVFLSLMVGQGKKSFLFSP